MTTQLTNSNEPDDLSVDQEDILDETLSEHPLEVAGNWLPYLAELRDQSSKMFDQIAYAYAMGESASQLRDRLLEPHAKFKSAYRSFDILVTGA